MQVLAIFSVTLVSFFALFKPAFYFILIKYEIVQTI